MDSHALDRSLVSRSRFPGWLRACNAIGDSLRRIGLPLLPLEPEALMRAARRRTGLSDFGTDHFREPLRVLLEDINRQGEITFCGRYIIQTLCLRLLTNRLRVRETLKRHPEILDVPIRRPLFVLGVPRTGTTLLQNLLAQDPSARPLLFWEMYLPWPAPEPSTRATDPRIGEARKFVEATNALVPDLARAHEITPEGPEECNGLFEHSFTSEIFELRLNVPGYSDWLLRHDMGEAYRDYRRFLQFLAWRCPGDHWILKAPMHLLHIETLLEVFPDACIVQTHRDPIESLPSLCRLNAIIHEIYTGSVDMGRIGRMQARLLAERIRRGREARARVDPRRCVDLHYRTLLDDPVAAVARIYEHFGYPFDEAIEGRIRRWLARNPQHRHGPYRYSLEEFGLDRGELERRFAPYREHVDGLRGDVRGRLTPVMPGDARPGEG